MGNTRFKVEGVDVKEISELGLRFEVIGSLGYLCGNLHSIRRRFEQRVIIDSVNDSRLLQSSLFMCNCEAQE
jgi:hypothetical protein